MKNHQDEVAAEQQQLETFQQSLLVFSGSSEEDVEHAKCFWKSLTLQPPLESRLVSADIKQRLPVAKPSTAARKNNLKQQSEKSFQEDVFRACTHQMQIMDDKERLVQLSQKRRESIDLLQKQRTVESKRKKSLRKSEKIPCSNFRGEEEKKIIYPEFSQNDL